jgi:bile acid-coenzyme A ligase
MSRADSSSSSERAVASGGDVAIDHPVERSISATIREHARERPDDVAVYTNEDRITWAELVRRSDSFARVLASRGVREGDFVAVGLPNGIAYVVSAVAIWVWGGTPLMVHYRLPEPELAAIMELANPRVIVGSLAIPTGTTSLVAPPVDVGSSVGDFMDLPDRVSRCWRAATSGGSTGRPKIIVSELPGTSRLGGGPFATVADLGDVALVPGPLYHTGPFLATFQALLNGATVVLMGRFEASEFLRTIELYGVTWTLVVPTMMHRIMQLPAEDRERFDLASLRILLHSAAPCPIELKRQFLEWLGPARVVEAYGGTEGLGSTSITGDESLQRPGSVGRPWPGTEIRVLDDHDRDLPTDEIGRVFFRQVDRKPPYHYLGAEKVSVGDWETLGDLGRLDGDGYLYLADRRTDLIVSGGSNIYPMEIESALGRHDAVESCLAVGVPDEDLGRRVHVVVQLSRVVSDEELRSFLRERLAPYKVPRSFERVEHPLRDEWGKARRFLYRRDSEDSEGRSR